MMIQPDGAAASPGGKIGLQSGAFETPIAAALACGCAEAASASRRHKVTIGTLLAGALLASVATPVMIAAGLSGAVVAAPLFLAGIAVAAASLVAPIRSKNAAAGQPLQTSQTVSSTAALPIADLFGASAFVVTAAGSIETANQAGLDLTRALPTRLDPPVLFDLLAAESRSVAMAALKERSATPVDVRLRGGAVRCLHIVAARNDWNAIAVLSAPPEAPPVSEPQAGNPSGAVLAAVSHELRTPLNAIIGFSGILENELFGKLGTDRQREYVGLIQSSGRHLLSVVNDILDVSKIEAGAYQLQCEHFLLDDLIDEANAMLRCQAADKGIEIVIAGPSGGTMIHGDRRAMHQMLVNLLANGVKFTDSGTVTLTWERVGRDLRLSVADTGIGIAADQIGKLGMPFVQASCGLARRYEGTGLGLAYVRGMSELHGGTMMIESQEGKGTTVTLDLPLVPRQAVLTEDQTITTLNHARKSHNESLAHAAQRRTA
ncbi:ATP-binding protein [Fulvimarina sp. 2208YS6-2-32]|uniref:histidine kinase n=1 Tax=Fulvimarina uroteuthidis TaxID=3098149 RepID=A0ABU5HY41_9HYPH|nr:ATP-binding protein [Fulvimarina sp. 2208YS6-2-32]MDY8107725.1 ATP-binding protein [Fulvimarina sp. 2208YS6-2-32]